MVISEASQKLNQEGAENDEQEVAALSLSLPQKGEGKAEKEKIGLLNEAFLVENSIGGV